jgi:hypothetical protein
MPANRYHFVTRWRVEGTREDVYRVIEDTPSLPRWWPAVWLKVEPLPPPDSYRLTSKGWLPYVLAWTATTTEKVFPERIALAANGDFAGRGVWTFRQDGAFTDIEYDWEIVADKPLQKYLSFALKPLFAANHNWAMRKGEESLKLELRRRAGKDAASPPPPTFLSAKRRRKLGLA